jgi:hypothetical protein
LSNREPIQKSPVPFGTKYLERDDDNTFGHKTVDNEVVLPRVKI